MLLSARHLASHYFSVHCQTIKCSKCWGIYLLVLIKQHYRPRIYIRSGTDTQGGIHLRLKDYDQKTKLPAGVKQALNERYSIVFKELLCWCPIPAASIRFQVRVLLLALEAMFSFALWAMKSRTKDYGMPDLCPWSRESMEYDGCCGHSPLIESVEGEDYGLTVEQIAVKMKELDERKVEKRRIARPIIRAENQAAKKYTCEICKIDCRDSTELKKHRLTEKHINAAAGITKELSTAGSRGKVRRAKNLTAKKYRQ